MKNEIVDQLDKQITHAEAEVTRLKAAKAAYMGAPVEAPRKRMGRPPQAQAKKKRTREYVPALSEPKKKEIAQMILDGISQREAARKAKVSLSSVQRIRKEQVAQETKPAASAVAPQAATA